MTNQQNQNPLENITTEELERIEDPKKLMEIANFYREGYINEGKRVYSIIKTFALITGLLALEAVMVTFFNHQDAKKEIRYMESITSQLAEAKRNYSEVYRLIESGKYEDARRLMEEQYTNSEINKK